jgi:hypothetical protein
MNRFLGRVGAMRHLFVWGQSSGTPALGIHLCIVRFPTTLFVRTRADVVRCRVQLDRRVHIRIKRILRLGH